MLLHLMIKVGDTLTPPSHTECQDYQIAYERRIVGS